MEVEGTEVRFTVYEVGGKWEEKKKTTEYKDRGLQANYDEIQHFDNVEKGKLTKTLHSEGIFFVFFFTKVSG